MKKVDILSRPVQLEDGDQDNLQVTLLLEKMFSKGSQQEFDADGCPKMEKYIIRKAFDCAPDGKVSKSANLPLVFNL